jgi:putative transposase
MDDELKIPIGRPYLTALMDSYSKCIVGFHLGFQEPSFDSVRSAILNTCLEKGYVPKQYPDVKHEWECYGKIETLVVDNGAEFWSKNLDEACRAVVSDIQYNPVGQPWLKPYIERFFGILNRMLLEYVPGKSFSSTADLKDYNPQKYAVVRFSTFISVFHKWLIDVYHRTSNARETNIPYLSWQEGVAEFPPIKYTGEEAQRLIIELGHTFNPILRKGGVHKHGIRYESPELVEYRKNTPNPAGKNKLRLFAKLDSLDLSCIYVYIKEQDQYIKVPSVDPENYTQGLTLVQHQTNRKLARLRNQGRLNLEDVAEARLSIDKVIQEEIEIVRQGSKRKPKAISGMKALAKRNNVSNVGESTVVPKESLQRIDNDKTSGPSQELLDDWDDMVSDLEPYK